MKQMDKIQCAHCDKELTEIVEWGKKIITVGKHIDIQSKEYTGQTEKYNEHDTFEAYGCPHCKVDLPDETASYIKDYLSSNKTT